MKTNNFTLSNVDTDAVMFCKSDGSEFTKEEQTFLLNELNEQFPDLINFEHDGYFRRVLILKAKNYVLLDHATNKLSLKGSSITDTKKEPALQAMIQEIIEFFIFDKGNLFEIYQRYCKEVLNIKDISRWSVRKSVSKKLMTSERANETKVMDALEGLPIREGDKYYLYNAIDGLIQDSKKGELIFYKKTGAPKMIPNRVLRLLDKWDGKNQDIDHYLDRVHDTMSIFKTVLDINEFPKYTVAKNAFLLDILKAEL